MRRAVVAIGWIALVVGWWLVWRGEGAWGCGFVALFALVRLSTARRGTRVQVGESPVESPTTPAPPASVVAPDPVIAAISLPMRMGRSLSAELQPDHESNSNARWRRLVWVSYGNAFLQGAVGLDEWYRHRSLRPANCTFRDGADRRLVADSGFAWLSELRQRGALRLSLDADERAPGLEGIHRWDTQTIICHFGDHRESWRMGEEVSDAERAARRLDDWNARLAVYPLWGRGSYQPGVDEYWRVAEWHGVEAPLSVDWQAVAADVRQTLKDARFVDEGELPAFDSAELFFQENADAEEWGHYPVLPPDPALRVPHQLLNELAGRRGRFDNDSHPKNEGNYWARMQGDEATLAQIEAYGDLLLALMGYVQRLAGSETRWQPRDLLKR